jgi:hypothetical protein
MPILATVIGDDELAAKGLHHKIRVIELNRLA